MSISDALKKNRPAPQPSRKPGVAATREIVASEDDAANFGPAMQACSGQERRFVLAVINGETYAEAARLAGYGTPDSTPATFATIGHRTKGYKRVADALVEEARNSLRTLAPKAVATVREIMDTLNAKERLKAADMVLARTDPAVSRVEGKVTHEIVDHTQRAVDYLAHMIAQGATEQMLLTEFGSGGLERLRRLLEAREKAKPIDAEYTVISEDANER